MSKDDGFYPFLEGQRIYLREVRPEDVGQAYYRWMNDPEVTHFLESRYYPNSMEKIEEFVRARLGDRDQVFLAIVLKEGDRHIGNIKLGPINWIHRLGDVGIMIGEKQCWGKGYAAEAIGLMVDYAFETLGLHKLTAGCNVNNAGSCRAFEKAGFIVEGTLKEHAWNGGNWQDVKLLGMVRK